MNNSLPTVSILMSVYNNDRFLSAAIDSMLCQTFTDFEFLILDDGSTDRSAEILRSYAAQDARIRLTRRENRGLTRSLNELLSQAQGEFIARMDADDIALPDRLARQVEFLQNSPQIVCVGTAQDWIDEDGDKLHHWQPTGDNAELQALMLSGQNHLCHPSALIRREAMLKVGGYDESLRSAQDLDLWLKLGELGELSNLPEVLLRYRVHSDSVSEKQATQQNQNALLACERAWQRRGIRGHYAPSRAWRHQFIVQCGWQLWMSGRRDKAIRYGLRAIKAIPLNLEGWRLLTCASLKPLPEGQP